MRLTGLRTKRFAECFEGFALVAVQKPERNAAGPCLVRRHDVTSTPPTANARAPAVAPFTKPRRPMFAIAVSSRS